jgi:hypothetical protein
MRTRPARASRKELLAGVHNALLDVTAQRLTDVQNLSGNVCRHRPWKNLMALFHREFPGACRVLWGRFFA